MLSKRLFVSNFLLFNAVMWGCDRPKPNIVFLDQEGNVAATGQITIPKLPEINKPFTGPFKLLSLAETKITVAFGKGHYDGMVYEKYIAVNLNPGCADYNILLFGNMEGDKFTGVWHKAFFGDSEGGKFDATLADRPEYVPGTPTPFQVPP